MRQATIPLGPGLYASLLFLLLAPACSNDGKRDTIDLDGGGDSGADSGSGDGGDGGEGDGGEGNCSPRCDDGQRCDPETDRCVADCEDVKCAAGQSCETRGMRAECVADCDTLLRDPFR